MILLLQPNRSKQGYMAKYKGYYKKKKKKI